jgi:predicted TIM-barrel fold metal-dependent hydrolase
MIIDAHNHADWHGHNLENSLKNMEKYNIDKTWLLTSERPQDSYMPSSAYSIAVNTEKGPISFLRSLSYIERAPEKFILGYAPDPRKPDAIDALKSAIEIYGVRIYGELKLRMMYDNWDAIRLFKFCGEEGLPVIVHIEYGIDTGMKYPRPDYWYGGGIEALERAIKACPDTTFIGHAPGFWAHISGDDKYNKENYPKGPVLPGGKLIEILKKYPNLYCDISAGSGHNALSRDPKFAAKFLTEFQDRILYGRDCFRNIHQEFLNSLGLSNEILNKIYSGNALRLVPL